MRAFEKLKIGMAQIRVDGGEPGANLKRAAGRIAEAAACGCRLVVLPECLDLGWAHPSARRLAQPIPGPHFDHLARAARDASIYVAAGLVERAGSRLYNAAVLIGPDGTLLLLHRKINELDIAHDLYATGDRLRVVETPLGTLALTVCADNFPDSLAIGHVLARMGAQLILSPSAWAVDADHDHRTDPYGALWRGAYGELARLYDVTVVGVSSVGRLADGPWKGRKLIGCSLAVGPGAEVLAEGPYGADAEALIPVDAALRPPRARGTQMAQALQERGYRGP